MLSRKRLLALSRQGFVMGCLFLVLTLSTASGDGGRLHEKFASASPTFQIVVNRSIRTEPLTGRLFLLIGRKKDQDQEPRLQQPIYFGVDVQALKPEQAVIFDSRTHGFPIKSLSDLPSGDYVVQAVANVYTQFHRADGHIIWAHMDQWDGQHFRLSPGNLVSEIKPFHIAVQSAQTIRIQLNRVLPPREMPPDTQWVKRIRIQSKLVSQFWGRPMYFGATVLLPKGYDEHPSARYPVIYLHGHFSLEAPLNFDPNAAPGKPCKPIEIREGKKLNLPDPSDDCEDTGAELTMPETRAEFYQEWISDKFPRFVIVTFQHPTPYYDDSFAINSVNTGPYGDAVMLELIPYVEEHFHIIRQPYARVLTGNSTGGWEALALQIYHPEFFGGSWAVAPDPVDFRNYENVNIYQDENAFFAPGEQFPGINIVRYSQRSPANDSPILSMRDESRKNDVLGSKNRSGSDLDNWEAVWGPVGDDGYPRPLWDKLTGTIDHTVADYMKEHGYDLRAYLEANWPRLGPELTGKLHVICGDTDDYYLNQSAYLLQDFLENTTNPYYAGSFEFGRPMKGHGWQPMTVGDLIRTMGREVAAHAPKGEDTRMWNY